MKEPIFSERSFIENKAELEFEWGYEGEADAYIIAAGVSRVLWQRLQLAVEVPYIFTAGSEELAVGVEGDREGAIENGNTASNLGDIKISAAFLFCCHEEKSFSTWLVRAEVAVPSGDRDKGIGGVGEFQFSLLGGHGFAVFPTLRELVFQAQFSYAQQLLKPMGAEILTKWLQWNLAIQQPILDGVLTPVLEMLGTTVVDADPSEEETTHVELAFGLWLSPFSETSLLSPFALGVGWAFDVAHPGEIGEIGVIAEVVFAE